MSDYLNLNLELFEKTFHNTKINFLIFYFYDPLGFINTQKMGINFFDPPSVFFWPLENW